MVFEHFLATSREIEAINTLFWQKSKAEKRKTELSQNELKKIISIQPLDGYRLRVTVLITWQQTSLELI